MEDSDRVSPSAARAPSVSEGHTHDERKDCPDNSQKATENGHIQSIKFEFSERTLSIVAMFISGMALAAMIGCIFFVYVLERRWALLDNDWVQMNAYLAQQGVTKDENGHYLKKEK